MLLTGHQIGGAGEGEREGGNSKTKTTLRSLYCDTFQKILSADIVSPSVDTFRHLLITKSSICSYYI